MSRLVYLDNNATTCVAPEVRDPCRRVPDPFELGRAGGRLPRVAEAELTRPHTRSRQQSGDPLDPFTAG